MTATAKAAASQTEQRHTPGPWRVAPNSQYAGGHLNIDAGENGGGGYVCLVGRPDEKSAIADARLIAAAPDYDDAARCYERWIEHFKDEIPDSTRNAMEAAFGAKLRAAIARTEGRS